MKTKLVVLGSLGAAVMALSAPAMADGWHDHDRAYDELHRQDQRHWDGRRGPEGWRSQWRGAMRDDRRVYAEPRFERVYAPAPRYIPAPAYGPQAVYTPAPVYVPEPVYRPAPVAYEPVYGPAPVMVTPHLGTLTGAIAGAAIGSTIGQGQGRTAAIAIGTVIGAAIGSNAR